MSSPVYATLAVSVIYLMPVCAEAQSLASVPPPAASSSVTASTDPLALDGVPPAAVPVQAPADSALDEPIERIAGTADGCAVLDKDFPGLRDHPMYGFFKRMSLHQIAAMSRGKITSDMLTQAQTDLSALPSATTPIAVSVH
jgi:hypothetical protein